MRGILFHQRFHQLILDGIKTSTIRDTARCKEGDDLSLRRWTDKPYRSKQQVLMDVPCRSVGPITISDDGIERYGLYSEPDAVARGEGFVDWADMLIWFKANKTLPYEGWLIQWGEKGNIRNQSNRDDG